jgi:hypothetical protein
VTTEAQRLVITSSDADLALHDAEQLVRRLAAQLLGGSDRTSAVDYRRPLRTRLPRRRRLVRGQSVPDARHATQPAVLLPVADGCLARMMHKPNGTRLTPDAALLLLWGIGLLVRHALSSLAAPGGTTAWPG